MQGPATVRGPRQRRPEAVAIHRLDRGRSAAVQVPRIVRDRSGLLPMERVAGDVRPVDVALRRGDGSVAYPRMVIFACLATDRLFARCFLLPRGEGIRRERVPATGAAMIADPRWGVARNLHLDSGREFHWPQQAGELRRHAHMWDARDLGREPGMRKALPYRPQSKVVESAVAALTRGFLRLIPGYTGRDRMKPETQNAGKAVTPFPGAWAELERRARGAPTPRRPCRGSRADRGEPGGGP